MVRTICGSPTETRLVKMEGPGVKGVDIALHVGKLHQQPS